MLKGDLADISSITNGTGSGKISFEGDKVVKLVVIILSPLMVKVAM